MTNQDMIDFCKGMLIPDLNEAGGYAPGKGPKQSLSGPRAVVPPFQGRYI